MKPLIALSLTLLPVLACASSDQRDWKFEAQESLSQTFKVASGENAAKLIVDNLDGFIHVTGTSGSEIQVKVEKRIRAESNDYLAEAKRDVKLDMTQQGNEVKLYADGPFRSHNWDQHGDHYRVAFDCEIQVPAGASVDLHSLNGAIQVKNTTGDFNAHSLNGKVEMEQMGGSGTVDTLNGSVKVGFSRNPTHPSSFKTLNASIDVYFHSVPDADIAFQTLNGGVFADFDVVTAPSTVKGSDVNNRFVYRSHGNTKVRAGNGGPELSFHTLNGSIRLHSKI